jgi:hypothetical protein
MKMACCCQFSGTDSSSDVDIRAQGLHSDRNGNNSAAALSDKGLYPIGVMSAKIQGIGHCFHSPLVLEREFSFATGVPKLPDTAVTITRFKVLIEM